ncbi:hypothetical protein ACJX0J_031399, partial [Zea mays]
MNIIRRGSILFIALHVVLIYLHAMFVLIIYSYNNVVSGAYEEVDIDIRYHTNNVNILHNRYKTTFRWFLPKKDSPITLDVEICVGSIFEETFRSYMEQEGIIYDHRVAYRCLTHPHITAIRFLFVHEFLKDKFVEGHSL